MFRFLQLIFTLALVSAVAQPSMASDHTTPTPTVRSDIVRGDASEVVELVIMLNPRVLDDRVRLMMPAAECGLSFTLEAEGLNDGYVTSLNFELAAGDHQVETLPLSLFAHDGAVHVLFTRQAFRRFGPCTAAASVRLYSAETEETAALILTMTNVMVSSYQVGTGE